MGFNKVLPKPIPSSAPWYTICGRSANSFGKGLSCFLRACEIQSVARRVPASCIGPRLHAGAFWSSYGISLLDLKFHRDNLLRIDLDDVFRVQKSGTIYWEFDALVVAVACGLETGYSRLRGCASALDEALLGASDETGDVSTLLQQKAMPFTIYDGSGCLHYMLSPPLRSYWSLT